MKPTEVRRFEPLYQRHLKMLKLRGKASQQLIPIPGLSVVSAAISIVDCCPGRLTREQLED